MFTVAAAAAISRVSLSLARRRGRVDSALPLDGALPPARPLIALVVIVAVVVVVGGGGLEEFYVEGSVAAAAFEAERRQDDRRGHHDPRHDDGGEPVGLLAAKEQRQEQRLHPAPRARHQQPERLAQGSQGAVQVEDVEHGDPLPAEAGVLLVVGVFGVSGYAVVIEGLVQI